MKPKDDWKFGEIVATFYWLHVCRVLADGVFQVKTSWYTESSHMSGVTKVTPEEPDYQLWLWIIQRPQQTFSKLDNTVDDDDIIDEDALNSLRVEFKATLD